MPPLSATTRVTYTVYVPSLIESTECHQALFVVQIAVRGNSAVVPPAPCLSLAHLPSRWNKPRLCKSVRITGLCACTRVVCALGPLT